MPAAVLQNSKGVIEPAGHPTRYSLQKPRGVRKKPKTKVDTNIMDTGTTKRKLKKKRSSLKIVQIQNMDAPERVRQLIKLAEDGRKKCNVLPPLEKEPSFYRTPRMGAVHTSMENFSDTKNIKRVSVEMDRKIVSHLRKHLNKRVQKRIDGTGELFDYPSDEEKRNQGGDTKKKQKEEDTKQSLFTNYSETGEKIQDGESTKFTKRPSYSQSPTRKASVTSIQNTKSRRSSSSSNLGMVNGSNSPSPIKRASIVEDPNSEPFSRSTPLPGIRKDSTTSGGGGGGGGGRQSRKTSIKSSSGNQKILMTEMSNMTTRNNSVVDVDRSSFRTPEDGDDEGSDDELFRQPSISPVSTPTLSRPMTREDSKFTYSERMLEILNGSAHKSCPADKTVIYLYVASGYSDTEAERTFMQEHLYPKLRAQCQQRGHELRIFDLHWGFKDALTDDHKMPEVMQKAIARTHESHLGINFVIFFGQKYGASLLPSEIPKDEFEAILKAALHYREMQKKHLRAKMAEIHAQKLEREQGGKIPDDVESIADTQPNSARTTSDGPPLSSRREEEEKEENDRSNENSPTVKEVKRRQSVAAKRDQQALRALREAEDQLPDTEAMCQWYVMDQNAEPPVYRMKNISSVYKDILKSDAAKRHVAKTSFGAVASKIQQILQQFAPDVVRNKRALQRYCASVFDMEVGNIMEQSSSAPHTACVVRTIDSICNHLDDGSAGSYLDLIGEKSPVLDKDSFDKMTRTKNNVLKEKIPEKNVMSFLLEWTPGGIKPASNREHFVYIERVCKTLSELVARSLEEAEVAKEDKPDPWQTALFSEVSEHVRSAHEKASGFQGRKEVLTQIKSYLKSDTRRPLVIHGKTGCGKSAILGTTVKEINRWFKSDNRSPRVLVRMIGSTMTSTNVRTMLRDLCIQLCHIYGNNPNEVPTDYKGIFNDFGCRIGHATKEHPLIIVLDSVDRLSDDHEGRKLQWLPPELPPHVHLIISTISEEKFGSLQSARKLLDGHDDAFLEVDQLPEQDAMTVLRHWLDNAQRKLTDHQLNVFMEAFNKCPYPLYLKVAFTEALTWTSFMKPEAVKLGETVKKIATLRFGRLERDHGEPLTKRALGYISASRHGITSNEMEDLLSLDDAVMDDVVAAHKPPRRRLPALLWVRLREDMEDLIFECRADNMKTITWAHTQIFEAAEERYLAQRDKAPSYHRALAEYFLGQWLGKPKPYTGNEKGADRFVTPQELYYEPADSTGDGSDRVYNLRKINELPFHLMRSQQTKLLKQSCLCNYEWMLAKLCASSLKSMLEEYQAILTAEPHEPELRLLSDVLHLGAKALRQEPRQLASQIVGRLHRIIKADHPKAPGDPKKLPNLHHLLAAAKQSSIPVLIPSVESMTEPGGILFDLLSGHSEPITALTLTSDGMRALTTSKDKTMKLWDIRSGKVVKSIDGICPNVSAIRTAKSNTLAVTIEGSLIKIWSLKSGECVFTIDQYVDPASICVAAEGQLLVAVFDGSNTFRSWNMDDFSMLCEAEIPDKSIHKDNSILIADSSFGDAVLHAFRSGNFATIQHARTGKLLKNLQCHEKSSSIVALAISREYFIVCCRQQYMALHEIHSLEIFDAKKGTYIRSVQGCVHDNIKRLYTNLIGSHAIAVSTNPRNNTSDVALFNLETEDHKHLAAHPGISNVGACLDFRNCMTGTEGENSLRIWDLSGKVNQPAPKLKKMQGICDIWPMIGNPRYVVAKAVNNGPISVWNVAKGKCLQSAVRIERGLTEGSDALVMRNTRLVILTDRGFSNVSDDSRPVFQTVLVYDLKLKKYIRKLPGCYIVPAPSHEYVLLDNDSLLGPSDNRSHFIIWNLVSGHAVSRIKTNFKEIERKRLEQGIQLIDVPKAKRVTSAMMTPWDKRAETKSARRRRHDDETEKEKQRLEELRKEKDNVVEQFLVSGDQKIIVASFYAHHLCVFDVESQTHTQTLQTEYSMMFLHTAALTFDGGHLVHANYDEDSKISYVTLWDCTSGEVKRRLKKETNVSALGLTDDAQRVVIGRAPNELHVWDPMKSNSLRRIRGYDGLRFEMNSKIFVVEDGAKAIVFAGAISMWDLEKRTVLAVFTPDTRIMACNVVLNGQLIVFGMYDKQDLVILKLMSSKLKPVEDKGGVELFGESTGDTSDEDDEKEEEGEEEEKEDE